MTIKKYIALLFLIAVSATVSAQLKSENYISQYGNLSHFFKCVRQNKKATVAFLGGSITNMDGWRNLVCDDLVKNYPGVKFKFINAGIPSLGSLPHAFRLQRDVLDKGDIDLLFIESAVNDKVNGTPAKIQQRALEGIIRHVHAANAKTDMVLMAFIDPEKIKEYAAGKIPAEVHLHQDLAKYYHLDFINLAKEISDRIAAREFTWDKDFVSLHPSPFGMRLYFNTIKTLLQKAAGDSKPTKSHFPAPIDQDSYIKGHFLDVHQSDALKADSLNLKADPGDSKFSIIEDWVPGDKVSTREGFVHIPVLQATRPGATCHINFKGRVIGIGVLSGPDAGLIHYSIDGKAYAPVNLYTDWSDGLHLPFYFILADDLKPGKHSLEIRPDIKSDKRSKGTAVRIFAFLEN